MVATDWQERRRRDRRVTNSFLILIYMVFLRLLSDVSLLVAADRE